MKQYAILTLALVLSAVAQVKTEVPPVVAGAKPMAVEQIKIHGAALEGNLENDAVDLGGYVSFLDFEIVKVDFGLSFVDAGLVK